MRTSTSALLATLLAAPAALASVATLRATIPGSLHQCEATNIFLFDTSNQRPVTIVFVPAAVAPASTTTLTEVLALGAYQVIEDITAPDASQTNFVLAIAEGESFATFGFFADGTGKNLALPRTVMAALPGATACNPATAAVAAAAAGGSSSAATTSAAAATTAVAAVTTTSARTTTTSAAAASTSLATSLATSIRASSLSSALSSASSAISSAASSAAASASSAAASASGSGTSGAAGGVVASFGAVVVAGVLAAVAL